MFDILDDLQKSLDSIYANVDRVANIFETFAYVLAYNDMVDFGVKGIKSIQEFRRSPEYLSYFVGHFQDFYSLHIDVANGSIINTDILATPSDLAEWQYDGWPNVERTAENYNKRLEDWASIYYGYVVHRTGYYTNKNNKRIKYNVKYRVKNPFTHRYVTYEEVISWRNDNYGNTLSMIPFWLPLNYGTRSAEVGPRSGLPNSAGVHFVEKAQARINDYLVLMWELFETYISDCLFNLRDAQYFLDESFSYINRNVKLKLEDHVDVHKIIRELAQ